MFVGTVLLDAYIKRIFYDNLNIVKRYKSIVGGYSLVTFATDNVIGVCK